VTSRYPESAPGADSHHEAQRDAATTDGSDLHASPGTQGRRGLVARAIGFFDSTAKVLVAVGGLIGAATALWAGIMHIASAGSSPSASAATQSASQIATAHVDKCEAQHQLTQQHQKISRTVAITAFDSCTWPAPAYADSDGFTEITAQAVPGPGQGESSDADWADRIAGPCTTFALAYDFGFQGALKHLAPFTAAAGLVTSIDQPGTAWPGGVGSLGFYPARNEVDVLHNSNDELAMAACRN
jgi:hypothetical protein